jgi:UDP:flavonoid glycosyltransferase YjiC (YdhE family)
VREIVRSRQAGVVLPERTPQALAEAVGELMTSPPDRAEIRRHAESFGWESVCRELADLLRGTIERAGAYTAGRASAAI